MMDLIDSRRFTQIDPLSHHTTTGERIGRALLWIGGVMVFLIAFAGVLIAASAYVLYQSGVVS